MPSGNADGPSVAQISTLADTPAQLTLTGPTSSTARFDVFIGGINAGVRDIELGAEQQVTAIMVPIGEGEFTKAMVYQLASPTATVWFTSDTEVPGLAFDLGAEKAVMYDVQLTEWAGDGEKLKVIVLLEGQAPREEILDDLATNE